MLTAALANSQFVFIGFLAIHARTTLGAAESYIGALTTAQMAGAVGGTFLVARFGGSAGSRRLLLWSRVLLVVVALGGILAHTDYAFRALFALYGAALWVNLVGHNIMTLELLPSERRATVLATFNLVQVPSMLLASQFCALLWSLQLGFARVAAFSVLGLVGAIVSMLKMPVHGAAPSAGRERVMTSR